MFFSDTIAPHDKIAVILGNGPSLRGFDFAKELVGFDTFGMSAACRFWHTINWYPTYYACGDAALADSLKDEIADLVSQKDTYGIKNFLLRANVVNYLKENRNKDAIVNYDFWFIRNQYHQLTKHCLTTGSIATLWAASLGYKRLILLGIDAYFPTNRPKSKFLPSRAVGGEAQVLANKFAHAKILQIEESPEVNKNYFFDGYHKSKDKFFSLSQDNEPENNFHYLSWSFLPSLICKFDVEIINANPVSKIDSLPKYTWQEIRETYKDSK